MPNRTNIAPDAWRNRTGIAALVAILAVLPGLIPAAVIIAVYSFMFKAITASDGGIVLELFAQLLWGLVAGAFAISATRYFFKRSNINIVRTTTLGFWSIGIVVSIIIIIGERGWSVEVFSSIANLVGLGVGPPALSFLLPIRFKVAALASLVGFFPGIGGGIAFAGVWIGVLQLFGGVGDMSFYEIVKTHWDQILFLIASGPAVAMIGVVVMFVYYSKDIPNKKPR